jgi:chromosome segregation ATPase
MTLDYAEYMNMTAQALAQHARENADISNLIHALADMISALVEENDKLSAAVVDLKADLEDVERARDEWQSFAESLSATVKGLQS